MELTYPLRRASAEDGWALADLVNYAGEGLPMTLWRAMAAPGENALAIGARRQAERAAEGQIVVVDEGKGVLAAMTGYPITERESGRNARINPSLAPLDRLEDEVVGTWLLAVLAAYPAARGRGFGKKLVRTAEAIARHTGREGVSIIVTDTNLGARRLYRRLGYAEAARAGVIKDRWDTDAEAWVLLTKSFAP